jgi:hypothetical protein
MTIQYNMTGKDRKKLVEAISRQLNTDAEYLNAPTFAYSIGDYSVDKNGTLTGNDNRTLVIDLCGLGFFGQEDYDSNPYEAEPQNVENAGPEGSTIDGSEESASVDTTDAPDRLIIEMPLDGFNPESLDNLVKLTESKDVLIKKALGVDDLPIRVLGDRVAFPWFPLCDSDDLNAYAQFISALCATAKERKRVTARPQESFENEKFTMRVWLIGLGLVGKEYGLARKLMMANLDGNSGHRYDSPDRPATPAKVRIPTPAILMTAEQKAKYELIQLWANTDKRREFLKDYTNWGIWNTAPELGLVYYRYDLPDGGRILAMEYQHENRYAYSGEEGLQTSTVYYLWDGEYFYPQTTSEYTIIERLKNLKAALQNELRSETALATEEATEVQGND